MALADSVTMDHIVCFVLMIAISSPIWSHPIDPVIEKLRQNTTRSSTSCTYKGTLSNDGEIIEVEEPCLLCQCKKGALTCGLRICSDLPNPPPSGCFIVHNTNQCCPEMICETEKTEEGIEVRTVPSPPENMETNVCVVNGSVYAEGSALQSENLCEYCYCIKGQQRCIKPKCFVPFEGCKALYSQNSCCPTQYDCRNPTSPTSKEPEMIVECEYEGVRYGNGDMVPVNKTQCENCYCMKGEMRCVPVTCETELNGDCKPIHTPGQCCPTSYICSELIMGIPENSLRSFPKNLKSNETRKDTEEDSPEAQNDSQTTTTIISEAANSEATTSPPEESVTESTTTLTDDNPKNSSETKDPAVDLNYATEISFQKKSETSTTVDTTTSDTEEPTLSSVPSQVVRGSVEYPDVSSRTNAELNNESKTGPSEENATPLPILDGLYSNSQTDDEYDTYDYNEPRLPPSLPNLIIFPFVAADAVVKGEEKTKAPTYDESSIKRVGTEETFFKDFFSPPTKTEVRLSGFIPRQPPLLHDSYQQSAYLTKETTFPAHLRQDRIPDLLIPSITIPPKSNSDQCLLKGHIFEHGELISEPGECESCICYYGDVMCQEVVCPPIRQGCRRTTEKDPKSCCGKMVCDIQDPDVPEYFHHTEKYSKRPLKAGTGIPEAASNPYRDAIRTEPAPDLPTLMDDLLPILQEQQTKKPVTVTYKNLVVDYYPDYLVTTTRDDVRKKNYKNPVFLTTELYPFGNNYTNRPGFENVTNFAKQTVTTSVSASAGDSDIEASNTKYPFAKVDFVRTSIRPIITVATEPSRIFELEKTSKPLTTKRSRPHTLARPRPLKKTTEIPQKEELQFSKAPGKYKSSTKTKAKTSTTPTPSPADSFSLDSVFRFFFNTETTTVATKSSTATRKSTKKDFKQKLTTVPTVTLFEWGEDYTVPRTEKYKDAGKVQSVSEVTLTSERLNKKPSISGLLKLAGCNIYGRMYRVGKIIAELSNSCLECICTDFGVECNPLIC